MASSLGFSRGTVFLFIYSELSQGSMSPELPEDVGLIHVGPSMLLWDGGGFQCPAKGLYLQDWLLSNPHQGKSHNHWKVYGLRGLLIGAGIP